MYVCTCVRMYVCTYVRMYVRTCVCMYVCVYVCMHACMCACVHVYSESPDDVLKRDATHDGRMPCGQASMGRQVSTARQAAMEHPEPTAAQEPAAPPVRWARLTGLPRGGRHRQARSHHRHRPQPPATLQHLPMKDRHRGTTQARVTGPKPGPRVATPKTVF